MPDRGAIMRRFSCPKCEFHVEVDGRMFEFELPSGRTHFLRCGFVWCAFCQTVRRYPFITPEPVRGMRQDMIELRARYRNVAVCEVCQHSNDQPAGENHNWPDIIHPVCGAKLAQVFDIQSFC